VQWKDENHEDWIREQVSFTAAYAGDRMIRVLFLPEHVDPPYRTVIYFPWVQKVFAKPPYDLLGTPEQPLMGQGARYDAWKYARAE
jgi:hypothetical protein